VKSNKLAVILIDMQDFFLQHFKDPIRKTLIENQLKVLDRVAKEKLPLIVVEYKCRGKLRGPTTMKLNQKIKSISHELIIKEHNSSFTDTNLDDLLKKLKVKKLFIMGINANACVQDTAISALHRGYKVIVSKGSTACASRGDMELSKRNQVWYETNCMLLESTDLALKELSKY
jgi:nicotinamidase-related amidase